jgi:hypothetical protein
MYATHILSNSPTSVSFTYDWNVAGAFVNLNGITQYSK